MKKEKDVIFIHKSKESFRDDIIKENNLNFFDEVSTNEQDQHFENLREL